MINIFRSWVYNLLIFIVLFCSTSIIAKATDITVQSQTITGWNYRTGNGTHKLRIYLDAPFIDSTGVPRQSGTPNTPSFFIDVNVVVTGTSAVIASFTIPSTTNGLDRATSRYNAYFFSDTGKQLGPYEPFQNFAIKPGWSGVGDCGAVVTCTTWNEIAVYNRGTVPLPEQYRTYTANQIDQKLLDAMSSSGGLTSLNGLTATTQLFAIGTSGTAPLFSSVTNTHTLNIPAASASGVTAGTISKTQYDIFNNKVSSVTGTSNQITVGGTATDPILSTPQNIHTGASPTFNGLTLTSAFNGTTITGTAISGTTGTFSSNVTITGTLGVTGITTLGTVNAGPITGSTLGLSGLLTGTTASFSGAVGVNSLTIGSLSGVLKASTGLVSGSATTDDLTEGATNKYFSNTLARGALSGTSPITYNSSTGAIGLSATTNDITEGSNLYFTNARARSALSGTTPISYNSSTGDISLTTVPSTLGGTGLTAIGTTDQLLSVNTGASALEYRTLSGTTNRVTVSFGSGTITLSGPQDLGTTNSPTFASLTTTDAGLILGSNWAIVSGQNYDIQVSNAANKPRVRYNGTGSGTGKWQISNDGTTFSDIITSASSGGTHTLLDNSLHTDTDGFTVTRGAIPYGKDFSGTIKWSGLALGASATYLRSNGTDLAFSTLSTADLVGTIGLPVGGTNADLSATGPGFLKQASTGANVTVAALAAGDIPNLESLNTSTGLPVTKGGTGLTTAISNNRVLLSNGTTYIPSTIGGTLNRVTVSFTTGTNDASPSSITLNLPQDIHTTATPTFSEIRYSPGTNYFGFAAPTSIATSISYKLPSVAGNVNDVLTITDATNKILGFMPAGMAMASSAPEFMIRDDFINSSTTSGAIGSFNWNLNGTATYSQGTSPNYALISQSLTATAGVAAGLSLRPTGSVNTLISGLDTNTNWEFQAIVAITGGPSGTGITSGGILVVGLGADASIADNVPGGYYIRYYNCSACTPSLTDTNFQYVARNASTNGTSFSSATVTDSGVAISAGFNRFRIRSTTAGEIKYSINSGTETTISTNLYSGSVGPLVMVENRTSPITAIQLVTDYISYVQTLAR